jgi:hypothetical protein
MTSTLLNMVVVPTMYLRYGRPAGADEPALSRSRAAGRAASHPPFAPQPRPVQGEG